MFLCAYWTVQKLCVKMLKVPNFEADGRADELLKSQITWSEKYVLQRSLEEIPADLLFNPRPASSEVISLYKGNLKSSLEVGQFITTGSMVSIDNQQSETNKRKIVRYFSEMATSPWQTYHFQRNHALTCTCKIYWRKLTRENASIQQ